MRIVFAGTPDIAATVLKALIESEHDVVAVYTQPDRPAGRGRKLTASPVKQLAQAHDIPVLQPTTLREASSVSTLAHYEADLMVVVAYGLIVPEAMLTMPKYGCWNIHVSLLPRWRGAAPIQRAIEAGDAQTGVTIMQMDAGLDTGDILLQQLCTIDPTDTAASLHDRLADLGADALLQALTQLTQQTLIPTPQSADGVTYAEKLTKSEAEIDWQQPADLIARKVRAFNPWPVAFCNLAGERMRIWQATAVAGKHASPGQVIRASKQGVDIATAEGVLRVTELQLPGKPRQQTNQLSQFERFGGI